VHHEVRWADEPPTRHRTFRSRSARLLCAGLQELPQAVGSSGSMPSLIIMRRVARRLCREAWPRCSLRNSSFVSPGSIASLALFTDSISLRTSVGSSLTAYAAPPNSREGREPRALLCSVSMAPKRRVTFLSAARSSIFRRSSVFPAFSNSARYRFMNPAKRSSSCPNQLRSSSPGPRHTGSPPVHSYIRSASSRA
jgi:hypothetical protein